MRLPILVSVPHAGTRIPAGCEHRCVLTEEQLIEDGDKEAGAIYDVEDLVAAFVTTDVPRAIVDLNRSEEDRRGDGVVKVHTIFGDPVYAQPLTDTEIEALLTLYHRPYHKRLSNLAGSAKLGIDCHTMLATAPPIDARSGAQRPHICLSHAGRTCPEPWLTGIADCLSRAFEVDVALNDPFRGGHIIRAHAHELPWVQLEISRAPFQTVDEKHRRFVLSLRNIAGFLGVSKGEWPDFDAHLALCSRGGSPPPGGPG